MLASLLLSGCLTSPGMREPDILTYVIVDKTRARCIPEDKCKTKYLYIEDMIGFQSVSPRSAGKIQNHHEALHEKLNKCLEQE